MRAELERLASLGVDGWRIWTKEISTFGATFADSNNNGAGGCQTCVNGLCNQRSTARTAPVRE